MKKDKNIYTKKNKWPQSFIAVIRLLSGIRNNSFLYPDWRINTDKKVLILGAKGMLGHDMNKVLSSTYEVIPMDIDELDITKKDEVDRVFNEIRPNLVVNCAAYTNVDGAESNIDTAFLVNAEAVRNVALACKSINSKLIHFSTDYIFDGTKKSAYAEDDKTNPKNIYGESKLQGEEYIKCILKDYIIIRTQWLYGSNGKNFVNTIIKLSKEKNKLSIVEDQIGCPTNTFDLSLATKELIKFNSVGIFNVANSGQCSWYEFTKVILKQANIRNVGVFPVASLEFKRPADRPKNSILDCGKFYNQTKFKMPNWQDSLKRYINETLKTSEVLV